MGVYNDSYAPNANTVTDDGTGGTIIAHALCLKCSEWFSDGRNYSIDTRSTAQPFIFALGPKSNFGDDSPEASVPRHSFVGRFTMDMTEATNYTGWYGRVPAPNIPDFVFPPSDAAFALANSVPAFDTMVMDNPLPGAHAALMCIAFVIIFPLGAVVMQFLKKALWHAAVQAIGFIMAISGFGVAVSFSKQYNRVSILVIPSIADGANIQAVKRFQISSPSYRPAYSRWTNHTAWSGPGAPFHVRPHPKADTNGPNPFLSRAFHYAIRSDKWWHRFQFCR